MNDPSEIESRIYRIRGQQLMLDSDLAELYGVTTKRLNEQVRRNLGRFPEDFMFQLTSQESDALRSQNATLKKSRGAHRKYRPLAFTELGVAMLSSVLSSERAIAVNIAIMRAFVKLRRALLTHHSLSRKLQVLEGRVNLMETDIRFISDDIRHLKNVPAKTGPTIKGFEKE